MFEKKFGQKNGENDDMKINYMTLYKLQKMIDVREFSNLANPRRLDEQTELLEKAVLDFMTNKISWSEFSTKFSFSAYTLCRQWTNCKNDIYGLGICEDMDCDLTNLNMSVEPVAYAIHVAWVQAYKIAKRLIELGYELDGTNAEKVQNQQKLMVSYAELSREEQLKDIYVFKGFYTNDENVTEPNAWNKYFSTEEIENGFIKYNINW